LMEFQPKVNLDFSLDMFKLAFIHSIHLLVKGPLGIIFKHFRKVFDPKDLETAFPIYSWCVLLLLQCVCSKI
jgi:hypothetical protein